MMILVRHAMPDATSDVPANEWHLSAEGQGEAVRLAEILPRDARLVSSEELKALQTLGPAGAVSQDARFNEVRRDEPFAGNWRDLRHAYVSGSDHPGWEPRNEVARRFESGINEHLAQNTGQPLVISTHGMAMTIWLTTRIGLSEPGLFWADLRFPDALVVDLRAGTVERLDTGLPGSGRGLGVRPPVLLR